MFNSTRLFARIFSITKFKATSLSIRYKLNSSSIFSQFSKFLINSIKEVKIFPLTASFSFLKPSSNQRARSIQIIFQKRNQNRETRSNFTVNFNFNKDRKFVKIFQFQCKDSKDENNETDEKQKILFVPDIFDSNHPQRGIYPAFLNIVYT